MSLALVLIFVAGGLLFLAGGADVMIKGAATLGVRLGVSPLWIGIVLVGFGTSTPELLTSMRAAIAGAPGLAVGNIIGSNIANILLILGLAATIRPLVTSPQAFKRDVAVLFGATALLTVAVISGTVGMLMAGCLLSAFLLYLFILYKSDQAAADEASIVYTHEGEFVIPASVSLGRATALFIGGLAGLLIGTELLLQGATDIARMFGMSEAVIGLTVVGVGTSLPELTTSIIAAFRGKGDVAFGNVIGSNIFNALAIIGLTGLVTTIDVPSDIARFDVWVLLGATLLLGLFAATKWTLARWEGVTFLMLFILYMTALVVPSIRNTLIGG